MKERYKYMSVKWTEEQLQAINKKGSNILVSAAAGSGKTTVLVQRIINKIVNENVDIDNILVVTFTNAAASEMKQKILDALYKIIDEDSQNEKIQKQISKINRANISTIHSFCLNVIRNNFFEIGISANCRVGDSAEIEIIKQEVLESLFEDKYEEHDEKFFKLLDLYTRYNKDEELKNMILKIYEYSMCMPNPKMWINNSIEKFNISEDMDFGNTEWGKIILDNLKNKVNYYITTLENESKRLNIDTSLLKQKEQLLEDANDLKQINFEKWDDAYIGLTSKEWNQWPKSTKLDEELFEIKERAQKIRTDIKNDIKKIEFESSKDSILDCIQMYPVLKDLENLIEQFSERFKQSKNDKNIIDFNDIEHLALQLLVDKNGNKTEVANKYEFNEIMIDEYQDSSLIQEKILKSVSNGKNIFMVGDVKQSIYRFRQARPDLFIEKYESFKKAIKEENRLQDDTKILLYSNFRSREQVLNLTNDIFQNIMSKEYGEIDYNEEEYLNIAGKFDEEKMDMTPELYIIDKEEIEKETNYDEEINENEEVLENAELEAKLISKKINELLDFGYKYKDIAILHRSPGTIVALYEKEFAKNNIPVFSDLSENYLDTFEINTIISLLKIVDNPMQDIPLVTILRSPICGLNDNELLEIKLNDDNKQNYYNHLLKSKNSKIIRFLNLINDYRKLEKKIPLDELIWKIYIETGFYYYVRLMPNGKLRQANLRKLFEKAKEYESTSFKGLFNFINFIEKVEPKSNSMNAAKILGENEDVVRLMSIHKSKGLEFPICFVCGVGKSRNDIDEKEKIILDQDMGFGINYVNEFNEYPMACKDAIKLKIKKESISEEMRVFYVAMTRSKEKLIFIGVDKKTKDDLQKKREDLKKLNSYDSEKMSPRIIERNTRYLDWLKLSYLKNPEKFLKLKIISKYDLIEKEEVKENHMDSEFILNKENINKEKYEKIDEIMNWKYNYINDIDVPSKVSVSELKRNRIEFNEDENETQINNLKLKKLDFEDEKENGAQRGTLIHLCLQSIVNNIKHGIVTKNENEIIDLIDNLNISEKEKELLKSNKNIFINFVNSKLFEEITDSKKIYIETPFFMNMKYKRSDEKVVVQGIIDLFYIDKIGKISLVDYKTDNITNEDEFIEKYRIQLDLYKSAIERSYNEKVENTIIYSTKLNKSIKIK